MALQNYQNFIEMTSNMIYIVAFGGYLKCPRKIYLNTQCRALVRQQANQLRTLFKARKGAGSGGVRGVMALQSLQL
jgi:hypothetical protein